MSDTTAPVEPEAEVEEDTPVFVPEDHEWTKWPDAEIMGRLLRRGMEPVAAKGLVAGRLNTAAALEITEELERVYRDDEGKAVKHEIPLDQRPRR